jgi:hypothetical protein
MIHTRISKHIMGVSIENSGWVVARILNLDKRIRDAGVNQYL